jgi:hypothetical protein
VRPGLLDALVQLAPREPKGVKDSKGILVSRESQDRLAHEESKDRINPPPWPLL